MRLFRAGGRVHIVAAGSDAGLALEVADVVVGERLRRISDDGRGRQPVQAVVLEVLDEAGRAPLLRALADVAQHVVLVRFVQALLRRRLDLAIGQPPGMRVEHGSQQQAIAERRAGHLPGCVQPGRRPDRGAVALDALELAPGVVAAVVGLRGGVPARERFPRQAAPVVVGQLAGIGDIEVTRGGVGTSQRVVGELLAVVQRRAAGLRRGPHQLAAAAGRGAASRLARQHVVGPGRRGVRRGAAGHPAERVVGHHRRCPGGVFPRADLPPGLAERVDGVADRAQVWVG